MDNYIELAQQLNNNLNERFIGDYAVEYLPSAGILVRTGVRDDDRILPNEMIIALKVNQGYVMPMDEWDNMTMDFQNYVGEWTKANTDLDWIDTPFSSIVVRDANGNVVE